MRKMRPTRARANLAGAGHPGAVPLVPIFSRSHRSVRQAVRPRSQAIVRRPPASGTGADSDPHQPVITRFGAPYLTRRARQLPHAGVRAARRKTLKPFDQRIEAE